MVKMCACVQWSRVLGCGPAMRGSVRQSCCTALGESTSSAYALHIQSSARIRLDSSGDDNHTVSLTKACKANTTNDQQIAARMAEHVKVAPCLGVHAKRGQGRRRAESWP